MKITIITPSYNQAQYLEQTIDSVLSQGYEDLEYMIFDGGSKDESVEIIKKYEKHLTYWESKPDKGQSDAINKGLARASGEVINWLNSDDYYESGTLNTVAEYFTNPNVLMLKGRSRIFDDADNSTVQHSRGTDVYPNLLPKTIGMARIDQPETFFRKSAIDVMGHLNPSLHYIMDKEWYIRFLLHFGLRGIADSDKIMVHFRYHRNSKTVAQQVKFDEETSALYAALAQAAGLDREAQLIQSLTPRPASDISPLDYVAGKEGLIRAALQYFLLHKGDHYYYTGDSASASRCLKAIQPMMLDAHAAQHREDLLRKNKVPAFLRKALRKATGK